MTRLKKFGNIGSVGVLLDRVLADTESIRTIQSLPSDALKQLIEYIGLEDAGDIVPFLTTAQLRDVWDADLWKSENAGEDEQFDVARFLLWISILRLSGEDALMHHLSALPEELLIMAFSEAVLVLNLDEMAVRMANERSDDVAMDEKALESALSFEFGEYTVISKGLGDFYDILDVLATMDSRDSALFERLMSACCYASTELVDDNGGLYSVLSALEMFHEDAAAERMDRRASRGYVAPSDAVAFLRLAEQSTLSELVASSERDPVTKGYFRELTRDAEPVATAQTPTAEGRPRHENDALGGLLREAGISPTSQRLLPAGDDAWSGESRTSSGLSALASADPAEYENRMRELAYLANLIVSAYSDARQPVRPIDAIGVVLSVCDKGIELIASEKSSQSTGEVQILRTNSADRLFRLGWSRIAEGRRLARFSDILAGLERLGRSSRV